MILYLSFSLPWVCVAQFRWAQQIGSAGNDTAEKHVVDPDGNIIVTGYFENSVSIGGFELTSMAESDIFVYKTRPDGTVLWAKTFGGPIYQGDVGVDTDANGNIYVAGGFVKELYFEGALQLTSSPNNPYWNSFLSKLDRDGNIIWTKGLLGVAEFSEIRVWGKISVSESGIVIAGNFSTSVKIDDQVLSNPLGFQGNNLFIAKFDLNGNLDWLKNPPAETNVECKDIFMDDSGNVYLTGFFTNTVHFDSYTITATDDLHSDIYLVKLKSSGVTEWVKTGLRTTASNINNQGSSLAVDASGNVYLIGILKGEVNFDNFGLLGNTDPDYSITNSFLVKYTSGGYVVEARHYETAVHLTDIEYFNGVYLLGISNTSSQFFYSSVSADLSTAEVNYLKGYGFPLNITVSSDTIIFISGQMYSLTSKQGELTSKGGMDGFLARVNNCKSLDPGNVTAILGPQELCAGTKASYAIDPVENASHYVWAFSNFLIPDGGINSDSDTLALQVNSGIGSGLVTVYAVDECGNKSEMATLPVQALTLPDKPLLEKKSCDSELIVQHAEDIEWYKDDELISGEDGRLLSISDSASYHVVSRNLCGVSESAHIMADPLSMDDLFFENVITPNADGKNDYFVIDPVLLHSELSVYNRWGLEVFQNPNYDNLWKADNLSDGMYYYTLRHPCLPNTIKGLIHVIQGDE